MSILIYSPKCAHSLDIIDYINKNEKFKQIVKFHNINELGIPPQFRNKISRVPTMLTKKRETFSRKRNKKLVRLTFT